MPRFMPPDAPPDASPGATRASASRGPGALPGQMLRFGLVGSLGVLVDTAVLYAALWLGAGLHGGRLLSYLAAASGNWALNRIWTFRGASRDRPGRQWLLFLLVNLVGFALNYGTYALLIGQWPPAAAHPVLGVAAGALAGMAGNFLLSRQLVFR